MYPAECRPCVSRDTCVPRRACTVLGCYVGCRRLSTHDSRLTHVHLRIEDWLPVRFGLPAAPSTSSRRGRSVGVCRLPSLARLRATRHSHTETAPRSHQLTSARARSRGRAIPARDPRRSGTQTPHPCAKVAAGPINRRGVRLHVCITDVRPGRSPASSRLEHLVERHIARRPAHTILTALVVVAPGLTPSRRPDSHEHRHCRQLSNGWTV